MKSVQIKLELIQSFGVAKPVERGDLSPRYTGCRHFKSGS
jgi:hypothetical protein